MNVYLARVNSPLAARFSYLFTRGEKAHVVVGDPALQEQLEPERKTKAYSFLVTFRENRETFLKKLKQAGLTEAEFAEQLVRDLLPEYDPESLCVSVVGHSDTGHYHYHVTILNEDLLTGKALRIAGGKKRKRYQELLGQYYRARFGFERGKHHLRSEGKPSLKKVKEIMLAEGRLKQADKEALKEEITQLAAELYATGVVKNRDELLMWFEKEFGWAVKRKGDTYVSLETPAGRVRLKGGVWHADFRGVEGRTPAEEERITRADPARVADLRRELKELGKQLLEASKASRERGSTRNGRELEERSEEVSEMDSKVELDSTGTGLSGGLFDWMDRVEAERSKTELEKQVSSRSSTILGSAKPAVATGECVRSGVSLTGWRERSEVSDRLREAYKVWKEQRKEEIELVKTLHPKLVLAKLGVPWKEVGSQIMAQAVWRGEKHPSVSIQQRDGKWLWRDHGVPEGEHGSGGSWIDLLMVAEGLSYVKAVRKLRSWLREAEGWDWDIFSLPTNSPAKRVEITEIKTVSHPALRRYLRERGIRVSNLPEWLKEIHWEFLNTDTGEVKHYFALGVRTVNGGWQVRNRVWKGALLSGGVAIATESGDSEKIAIVEGIFDALSLRQAGVTGNFVILGGTKNIVQVPKLVRDKEVILALDRDQAGLEAENWLLKHLSGKVYRLDIGPYNDPNEALREGWQDWAVVEVPRELWLKSNFEAGKMSL